MYLIDFYSSALKDKKDTLFMCVGSRAAGTCDSVYVSCDSVCVFVCVRMAITQRGYSVCSIFHTF